MQKEAHMSGVNFFAVWILLMILTAGLIWTGSHPVAGRVWWIGAMALAQAYLVSFHFMHLRVEKLALILNVLIGVLATAFLLYGALVWDGARIMRLTVH